MAAAAGAAGAARRGVWARLGDTRLGRWCRALLQDYSTSLREATSAALRRPATTAASLAFLGLSATLATSAPDLESLETAVVAAGGILGQIPPGSRSPRAERHVLRLTKLRERGRIRVRNLGFLSLAAADPHGGEPALYAALCPHLRPRVWELWGSLLLDVGFLGRWWLLEGALRDCDVNEEEFRDLPAELRRVEPRDLRSESNERLRMERWRAVVLSEEEIDGEGG